MHLLGQAWDRFLSMARRALHSEAGASDDDDVGTMIEPIQRRRTTSAAFAGMVTLKAKEYHSPWLTGSPQLPQR